MDQDSQPTGRQGNDHSRLAPVATPLCFHHADMIRNPNPDKTIKRSKLINLWNHLHFMEDMVYVHLHHPHYKEDLLIQAHPAPCVNGSMICRWPYGSGRLAENAVILNPDFPLEDLSAQVTQHVKSEALAHRPLNQARFFRGRDNSK